MRSGDISSLVREGCAIQRHLDQSKKLLDEDHVAHIFSKLMMAGKVKSALRFITDNSRGGILKLDDHVTVQNKKIQVREILQSKHPASRPACENSLLYGPVDHIDPILFDADQPFAMLHLEPQVLLDPQAWMQMDGGDFVFLSKQLPMIFVLHWLCWPEGFVLS